MNYFVYLITLDFINEWRERRMTCWKLTGDIKNPKFYLRPAMAFLMAGNLCKTNHLASQFGLSTFDDID